MYYIVNSLFEVKERPVPKVTLTHFLVWTNGRGVTTIYARTRVCMSKIEKIICFFISLIYLIIYLLSYL